MASWIVHLRIADLLMNQLSNIEKTEFIFGNIAPDSGIPSEDWKYYTPSKKLSHFYDEANHIQLEVYIQNYYTPEKIQKYSKKEYSFYLGYLVHLITDILWVENIVIPCNLIHQKEKTDNPQKYMWDVKADWYDLDFLYLSNNPHFDAFQIYKDTTGFQNTYMDIFAKDAFDNRHEYIVGFYSEKRNNLDREYPYLNKDQMDKFVEETFKTILNQLNNL